MNLYQDFDKIHFSVESFSVSSTEATAGVNKVQVTNVLLIEENFVLK